MENAMSKSIRRRGRKAFTLLEVMMVVVIIGLLAAFIVPKLFSTQGKAERDLMQATVDRGLNGALDLYHLAMGRYPRQEDGGLMALVDKPDDEQEAKKWGGPYLKADQLKDSWGTDFVYECPGRFNPDSYDLSSAGPDKQAGTEDDITNWKKE
jgi:general secretion pathway protein G